jgi:hypothetical protein
LKKLGLKAAPDRRERASRPSPPAKTIRPAKAPKPAPRERIGLPVEISRRVIVGAVKYCERCHCPVVDKPERWAEHNRTVHTAPVFPVAGNFRRIA